MIKGQWLALTTDLWRDVNNNAFVSLTVHFITKEWEMTSLALECSPFEGWHAGENIMKGV